MLRDDDVLEAASRLTPQWLAGFFDGEGSVGVYASGSSYTVEVSLTQKDVKILSLVVLKFQCGNVIAYHGANNAICHRARWRGRTAIPILECIKDYSIVKRRQIELGIALLDLVSETSVPGISEAKAERRRLLASAIKTLNKEGNISGEKMPEQFLNLGVDK